MGEGAAYPTADAIGPRPCCARDRLRDDDADDVEHPLVRGGLALLTTATADLLFQ